MPAGPAVDAAAQLEAVREVLRAISRHPFDLEPVLAIVVERMALICHADMGVIFLPAGERLYRGVASWHTTPEHDAIARQSLMPVDNGTIVGRVVLSGDVSEVEDAATDPTYTWKEGQRLGRFHTVLGVPMYREDRLIGVAVLGRTVVRRFSPDAIELVRTFIDLAAIVLDNVRLLGTIERQREELVRYVPSTVGELISSDAAEPILAGHRRQVSAVFCDLRGFTAFAETAEPEEVIDILREYQGEMGRIILQHGGTLEHYAGDGIMVFLNDPHPIPDHPMEAVRMALDMRSRFDEVAAKWTRAGFDLGFGIGISTGYATIGRIGFEGHYAYAVIGSVPNLAARLCAMAEPGQIVVSGRAHTAVESRVSAEPLGSFQLKGFSRPIDAWAVAGLRPD